MQTSSLNIYYDFNAIPSFEAYETAYAMSGDYIIEGSDTRIISDSELDRLTKEEVALARNEIYKEVYISQQEGKME